MVPSFSAEINDDSTLEIVSPLEAVFHFKVSVLVGCPGGVSWWGVLVECPGGVSWWSVLAKLHHM